MAKRDYEKLIKDCKARYEADKSAWSEIYKKAADDLYFLSDADDAQWNELALTARRNRNAPALTIDQLGQFVHQVVNDIRMNTPSINVFPDDGEASEDVAGAYKAIIRGIEYQSNADEAYDTAAHYSVKSGIGFLRVEHDYSNSTGFEQDLIIKRVVNPLAIYLDGSSIEADGSDARHVTVTERISVDLFKSRYPDYTPSSFEESENTSSGQAQDYVTIAEQFIIEESDREIGLNDMGDVESVIEGKQYQKTRKVKERKVRRVVLSGQDVLADTYFPGEYLPIIPVYGEEEWVKGKRKIYSLIRKSKDAQKQYNLWKSIETELLMKQPEAPIMAAVGSIDGYEESYKNPAKSMVLYYNPTDGAGNPLPMPQRLSPPTIPTGVVNAAKEAIDDIKATLGMYAASLGARGNETSGVAINARKLEGDVATYHFGDNLTRSVTQLGRVLVCAIPQVYDTPRVVGIVDEEDNSKQLGVNGKMVPEQEETINLALGKYGVRVNTGASYTTKRQESAAFYQELLTRSPDMMTVMGDLFFKNLDVAGSEAMASRMKKLIDPKLLEDDNENPALAAANGQLQQMQAVIMEMQQQLAAAQEALQNKQEETQLKAMAEAKKLELKEAQLILSAQSTEQKPAQEAQRVVISTGAEEAISQKMDELTGVVAAIIQAQAAPIQELTQAISGLAMSNTAPKRILRNKQGLIEAIE